MFVLIPAYEKGLVDVFLKCGVPLLSVLGKHLNDLFPNIVNRSFRSCMFVPLFELGANISIKLIPRWSPK